MTSNSNNESDDTDNKWVQWIKDGIANEYINYHDYNEFQDMERIGVGGFGNVYRANWKSLNTVISLKSSIKGDDIMKEIVNEVITFDDHPNGVEIREHNPKMIDKRLRIKTAVEIFKETADKGIPSAQLRYGICLWRVIVLMQVLLKLLIYKKSSKFRNSAGMYIIGKAYWNGGNGVIKDKNQGSGYLKRAALNNHLKAKEMCIENNINYNM
ncbi:hypothetical protein RhiirC2_845872 [Rhizophagus irregularis]|uniref:Protein kinase domain-containing protein n=1 Tax=Rhizophagus irregularis TaxID=588596 RepID=A0A2N1NNW3_9GLOM|nr:hypothetical protein RhiirC2_845872 [Rhizophagus irregularis]